jgi:hypothetical protein
MQREALDRLNALLTTAGDPVAVNVKGFNPHELHGTYHQ